MKREEDFKKSKRAKIRNDDDDDPSEDKRSRDPSPFVIDDNPKTRA